MDNDQTDRIVDDVPCSQFLSLPPEIHEDIFRHCGVRDIQSLALVNRLLNRIVHSKLRDLLAAACRNGKPPLSGKRS